MELFLPVAVQFLHKGNREISRHMARYLSLAAGHHAGLLKPHVQTIMDSIMSGKGKMLLQFPVEIHNFIHNKSTAEHMPAQIPS